MPFVSFAEKAAASGRVIHVVSVNTLWFQQVFGPALPTTTQPGEMDAAPSPTGSASVSSRFFPKRLASEQAHTIYTTL